MNLTELAQHPPGWLRDGGPQGEVVVSSRVRLARNLAGMPFLNRCSEAQTREVAELLGRTLMDVAPPGEKLFVDVAAADPLDQQLLVERHLISRQHAEGGGPRGVAIADGETVAVMVNEEDHLRAQVLAGGLQLQQCHDRIRRLDDDLESRLSFAYSGRFGYLTACPTNVGTALRVSVMMHLPALKMTGQLERALRAARDMRLAVRGLYGEGTEAIGDYFQISNQTTLGKSEEEIIEEFVARLAPPIIEYEQRARAALLTGRRIALEDRIHRALAVLRAARLISSEETLYLLSHLRLGVSLGLVDGLTLGQLSELALLCQPAHLQRAVGGDLSPADRGRERAALIRRRLEAG